MIYSSKLIEEAVNGLASLPGIGKKTALRLALFLLRAKQQQTEQLSASLCRLRTQIRYCQQCHNVADELLCSICTNPRKNSSLICIVENIQDIIAIENTSQYNGLYHVLGGVIAPIEGIGPEQLQIDTLIQRVEATKPQEIIFALSATIQGDTTAFYIKKRLEDYTIKLSTLARGVAVGSELEYTDEMTLGRSIAGRITYQLGEAL
ncbi:MAG: recombination mediator RecR [Bacteroidota bacterium]